MKAPFRRAAAGSLRAAFGLSGDRFRRLCREALLQNGGYIEDVIERIPTKRGIVAFHCLGDLPLWRARTLLSKEPETIEWIDSFEEGDVYWDIGANVGVYALYAAINRKIRVLAFEPSAANYFLLNRNIELNGLADFLQAYCIALSDTTSLDALNMQSTDFGGALSSFGVAVDSFGHSFTPHFRQGMIGFSLDEFVRRFNPAFPNHLKVDVDGIEDRIIAGGAVTLADPRLKSLSVELDAARPSYTEAVIESLRSAGLKLVAKRHSDMIAAGAYKDVFNYQFRRLTT